MSPQVVYASLHILFYVGSSSSDHFDFLQFREDSEPWITLDIWRLVCMQSSQSTAKCLAVHQNLKKCVNWLMCLSIRTYKSILVFLIFSIFPILEC